MKTLSCEATVRAVSGEPLKREGAELLYRCPQSERHSNGDAHPSLKVNPRKDTWGCFVCGVGGTAWQLAAFLARLDPSDKAGVTAWLKERGLLNGKRAAKAATGRGPCVAEYVYCDADGNPIARKLRFEPGADGRKKDFVLQRFENAVWVDGLAGVKIPLYRLREIGCSSLVVLTEGEKDADAGAKIGLPTTTSGGVGSFREDHAESLRGKYVVIVADADDPGREHAHKVAAMLHGKTTRVKVCEIPASKDLAEAIDKGVPANIFSALFEDTPEWKPATGAEILGSLLRFVRRFVSLTEAQARVVSVWAAHTHAIDAADFTPYLNINSAEKESGKTRLLEILKVLVANPWGTENASPAAMVRKVHGGFETGKSVTVLFDERDSQTGGDKERAEAIRGILNSGYERGGCYSRCQGEGANQRVVDFQTFGAKALAGIGNLSDTVASRSVPIRMKRAQRGSTERFRKREVEREASEIKARLAAWCDANAEALHEARPASPEELSDRQTDCCEPLLAIADLAGGDWPETARRALLELCAEAQAGDQSTGVRLLSDIRQIFDEHGVDRISSVGLVDALVAIETSSWADFSRGKPLTPPKLARLLARYEVTPGTIRVEGKTPKGYYRRDFADAFTRYLPPLNRNTATTSINTREGDGFDAAAGTPCGASENGQTANKNGPCGVVAVSDPANGAEPTSRGVNGHAKRWVGLPPRPVPCAICGQILESALALSKHLDKEHSPQNGVQQ